MNRQVMSIRLYLPGPEVIFRKITPGYYAGGSICTNPITAGSQGSESCIVTALESEGCIAMHRSVKQRSESHFEVALTLISS